MRIIEGTEASKRNFAGGVTRSMYRRVLELAGRDRQSPRRKKVPNLLNTGPLVLSAQRGKSRGASWCGAAAAQLARRVQARV